MQVQNKQLLRKKISSIAFMMFWSNARRTGASLFNLLAPPRKLLANKISSGRSASTNDLPIPWKVSRRSAVSHCWREINTFDPWWPISILEKKVFNYDYFKIKHQKRVRYNNIKNIKITALRAIIYHRKIIWLFTI